MGEDMFVTEERYLEENLPKNVLSIKSTSLPKNRKAFNFKKDWEISVSHRAINKNYADNIKEKNNYYVKTEFSFLGAKSKIYKKFNPLEGRKVFENQLTDSTYYREYRFLYKTANEVLFIMYGIVLFIYFIGVFLIPFVEFLIPLLLIASVPVVKISLENLDKMFKAEYRLRYKMCDIQKIKSDKDWFGQDTYLYKKMNRNVALGLDLQGSFRNVVFIFPKEPENSYLKLKMMFKTERKEEEERE